MSGFATTERVRSAEPMRVSLGVAREDEILGTVDGGERHRGFGGEQVGDPLRCGAGGQHRATRRQPLHQPPARGDQLAGVVEVEDARHRRSREFADTVPDQPGRSDAEVGERFGDGVFHGEDRRLGERGGVDAGPLVEQQVPHRAAEVRGHGGIDQVQCLPEPVARLVQRAPHAGELRSLAGEHPADAHRPRDTLMCCPQARVRTRAVTGSQRCGRLVAGGVTGWRTGSQRCGRLVAGAVTGSRAGAQLRYRFVAVVGDDGEPVPPRRLDLVGGPAELGEVVVRHRI